MGDPQGLQVKDWKLPPRAWGSSHVTANRCCPSPNSMGGSQILEEEKQGLGEAALWGEKRGVVSHHLEGLPRAPRLVEKEGGWAGLLWWLSG